MKTSFVIVTTALSMVLGSGVQAQTINWGSEVLSSLADSKGSTLDDTYVFELGSFKSGFVPVQANLDDWFTNWNVFDRAAYNKDLGYITSSVQMQDNGTSSSAYQTPGAPSFEGLEAYLWIRKDEQPVAGNELLLTHATHWIFPTAIPGCCDNGIPLEWSVSDLTPGDMPKFGNQGGKSGPGESAVSGSYALQTYTFVPEPSGLALIALGGLTLALNRRRAGI
jgi:hypothetical protein